MLNNSPLPSFSLIVPAAGHGSRLSKFSPKSLAMVGNESLIELSTFSLRERASESIIIAQDKHQELFKTEASRISMKKARIISQENASGSAYAVSLALGAVNEDMAVVVWGDHVGAQHFDSTILLQALRSGSEFVLPIISRDNPYVYFNIEDKKIVGFHETRKGCPQVTSGFSDIGVFGMKVNRVRKLLNEWIDESKHEPDLNFLSFFGSDKFEELELKILEISSSESHLTRGINTDEELEQFTLSHETKLGNP
jgi:bifunctional N-acetylglucosamine-1-phosphate-uridyltransferase/glucosamine-1-phosphate-acetyltransferase GlmU-like protein